MLKGIVHIDLSEKYLHKKGTGIAAVNSDKGFDRGLALSSPMLKTLRKKYDLRINAAILHAICINKILRYDLDSIEKLIICNDVNFKSLKIYLQYLFGEKSPIISDLREYRKEIGKNIKSLADKKAKKYRRRALKNPTKRSDLNVDNLSLKEIEDLWNELASLEVK